MARQMAAATDEFRIMFVEKVNNSIKWLQRALRRRIRV